MKTKPIYLDATHERLEKDMELLKKQLVKVDDLPSSSTEKADMRDAWQYLIKQVNKQLKPYNNMVRRLETQAAINLPVNAEML